MTTYTDHLIALYGPQAGQAAARQLEALLERYAGRVPRRESTRLGGSLSERDAILITYGDQVQAPGEPPLRSLAGFCEQHLAEIFSGVHILPFYPSSSDDGFSVIDYRRVDPALGDWADLTHLGQRFGLMFDAVINHVSAQSGWFQAFLQGDPGYQDYFIRVEGDPDLSQVVRPRTLPLLTEFATVAGPKSVWTTFSPDQIDLNYRSPQVLLEVIDTLLEYVARGAELIRLDAIAYLWKELGTACIHLPQTHRIIQLLRTVLDQVAPHVFLITETNVPHQENLSYFGDGQNEAQLVYNFALPPLTLHTLHTGDAAALTRWASELKLPSPRTTFFNFLASHDGIGLNPLRGILAPREIGRLIEKVRAQDGLVSYKNNPDGQQSPYELNCSYFDAVSDPNASEPLEIQVDRFIAAHAILLSLVGVPGIYFHSLVGSRNWPAGVTQTGRNRTINRQKLDRAVLERELDRPGSLRHQVFERLECLLAARRSHPAFYPYGRQEVVDAGPGIFALWRFTPDETGRVLCLQNVSSLPQPARGLDWSGLTVNLVNGLLLDLDGNELVLDPYQTLWLV